MKSKAVLIFFLLSLFIIKGYGQDILSGKLLDKSNKKPIPYAHIKLEGKSLGTTTDSLGNFRFIVTQHNNFDTVTFSSIGYKTLYLPVSKAVTNKTFYLAPDTTSLPPIYVSPLTPEGIMLKCIENIPQNYYLDNFSLTSTYAISVKIDSSLHKEAINNVKVTYPKHRNNTNKVINFEHPIKLYNQLPYDISKFGQLDYGLTFEHIHDLRGAFNKENLSDWEFYISGYSKLDNKEVVIINAEYKASKKVMAHKMKLYILLDSYVVNRIDFIYFWNKDILEKQNSSFSFALQRCSGVVKYEKLKSKYSLNFLEVEFALNTFSSFSKSKTGSFVVSHELNVFKTFKNL